MDALDENKNWMIKKVLKAIEEIFQNEIGYPVWVKDKTDLFPVLSSRIRKKNKGHYWEPCISRIIFDPEYEFFCSLPEWVDLHMKYAEADPNYLDDCIKSCEELIKLFKERKDGRGIEVFVDNTNQ